MKRRYIGPSLLVSVLIGSLVGCASRGSISRQNQQISSQPDTGQLVDYLHFAGLSYGDTFDDVVALFGDPTSVDLNDGEYTFASAYYEIQGERCLAVSYDKSTRRVETVEVACEGIRPLLLAKRFDDPKLMLFAQHRDSILGRYGSPASISSGNYEYEFESEGGPEGLINFVCYDFWDSECKTIRVQWFYPLSEEEIRQTLESTRQDLERISERKRRKIRQLLDLTQAADQGKQFFETFLSSMKPSFPNISKDVWAELFAGVDFEKLIDLMVPIYDQHLTEEEVDDLIVFFSSPTGRSFIKKQPLILKDSFAVGQEWGRTLAREIREKLEARKKKTIGP